MLPFREVWLCDFEFQAGGGEQPSPVCMVAREYFTGRELRLWQDELRARRAAPFPVDRSALFVAYYASAELGCFLALGWPLPEAVLDSTWSSAPRRTDSRHLRARPCSARSLTTGSTA